MNAFIEFIKSNTTALINVILLGAGVLLLLFGLISLIVTLAKKSALFKKIVAGILVIAGLTSSVVCAFNVKTVYDLTEQQNYVACELLELESFDAGRDMAELANERVHNETSAKIISLSLGLSGDAKLCSKMAAEFGKLYPDSEDLETIAKLSNDYKKAGENADFEKYQNELYGILDDVKSDLEPHDEDAAESIAEALNALEKGTYVDDDGEERNGLKQASRIADDLDQEDPLTLQLQAKIAGQKGDEEEAFKYLEKLVKKDATTSNKVAFAAAAINGGYTDKNSESEKKVYKDKIESLNKEIDRLKDKKDKADEDEEAEYDSQIAEKEAQIASLKKTIKNIDLVKAINYVTSFLSDADATVVNTILAEIYYMMDNAIKADEYSSKVFGANLTTDINERLTADVIRIVEHNEEYGMLEGEDDVQTKIEKLIAKTHMGCTGKVLSADEETGESFAIYLNKNVNSAANAIKIGDVTTVDLENFEVSVNISRDNLGGRPYTKEDFAIFDMGVQVTDYEMITNSGNKTSVCLVFDNSGSMSGTNIQKAKEAVTGFIANVNPNVEVGLVRFDDSTEILCDVTSSTGQVTKAAMNLYADGGTDIPGGLHMGIEALKNKTGNKIIILLTDGADGNSGAMPAAIERLKQEGIVVYSVGFGGAEADYLGNISSQTGGQLMYAQNPEDLQEMYRLINGFISNDYTFNFKTSADSDALERTVKIVMPDGYYDEIDYVVGLTKEEIDVIINAAPKSDYYRQIGGSNKNGGIN